MRRRNDPTPCCSVCRRPLKEQYYRTDPKTMAIQKVWACLNVHCPNYQREMTQEIPKKDPPVGSLGQFLEVSE